MKNHNKAANNKYDIKLVKKKVTKTKIKQDLKFYNPAPFVLSLKRNLNTKQYFVLLSVSSLLSL